jgi:spore germination cell wall hydrolase CwlJ-like protein
MKQVAALELSHIKAVEEAFYETNKKLGSPGSQSSSPSLASQKVKALDQNDDADSRPIKRRKSNFAAELGDDSPASASKSRKQKPGKQDGSTSPSSKSNQKRRKSSTGNAAAKPSRENLTEEQKRENHIKSEQKRRTLIREGFEDLNNLVPGLRGGGFSKSAVLIMSADWLENLLRGNEVLRQRLNALQNR